MKNLSQLEDMSETSRLLSELDSAIGQSSLMRDIVNKCEYLHLIEKITGPSKRTQLIRREIEILEDRLTIT